MIKLFIKYRICHIDNLDGIVLKNEMEMETHLEYQLKNVPEDETLEERYLRLKKFYLVDKLARSQRMIDEKDLNQEAGFLAMITYIYDYIQQEVGEEFTDKILDGLSYTGWPLRDFRGIMKRKGFSKRIEFVVEKFSPGIDTFNKQNAIDYIMKLMAVTGLELKTDMEIQRVIDERKFLYREIDSYPDELRRDIVEKLKQKEEKKIDVNLLNIGVIPTELCTNNCRFCLASWKADTEERLGQPISPPEKRKIIDQVLSLASVKGLIITITGGEPFLEFEEVLYILKNANSRVDLTTSGRWADNKDNTKNLLDQIKKAANSNSNPNFELTLQVSLDAFHQEIRYTGGELKENVPLEAVGRIVELIHEDFPEIEVVLLTKLTRYEDPLVHLIRHLEKKGFEVKLKGRYFDENAKIAISDGRGTEVERPGLLKGYLSIKSKREKKYFKRQVLVYYSVVESIGKAESLESFEYPGYKNKVQEFLEGNLKEKLPLIGLEVSDDGNVYPGAHSLYSWSVGNVLKEPLENIYSRLNYDPLIIAMEEAPGKILAHAKEVEPNIDTVLKKQSSPLAALFKILETPWLRLYITRRLIMEDTAYSKNTKEELRAKEKEELIEEYHLYAKPLTAV